MKERLFTFGCSFTRYYWPTWAEILGREYDYFENWGNGGLGNRAIAERLAECIANNTLTEHDTIIVQWSEFHRFDIHLPQPRLPEGWAQGGNMLLAPDFEKSWVSTVWDERSFVMHTLNFMSMAIALLETLPCKWYMTSIRDLKNDIVTCKNTEMKQEFCNYLKLFDHPNWLPPMNYFFDQYDFPKKSLINEKNITELDLHPIPIAHYGWLVENLSPLLNKTPNEEWADAATKILLSDDTKYYTKLDSYFKNQIQWSGSDSWIRGVIDTDYAITRSLQ
jgi:hypothetical protein